MTDPHEDLPGPVQELLDLMRSLVVNHPDASPVILRMDRHDGESMLVQLSPQYRHEAVLAMPLAWGADTVTVGMDAMQSNEAINPRTGREWEPGEMQANRDLDIVWDCSQVLHGERSPLGVVSIRFWSVGYEQRDDGLWWHDLEGPEEPTGGDLVEALRGGLTRDTPPLLADMDRAERVRFTAELGWRRYDAHLWVV